MGQWKNVKDIFFDTQKINVISGMSYYGK